MNETTKKMLNQDPILEVEKMLNGKSYKEFNDFENLFMLRETAKINANVNKYFATLGDTHFNMSWNEFKKLIENKGFKLTLSYDFKHGEKEVDEFIIYYHPLTGLVITATSYWNKKDINGGTLYGEIQANNKESCSIIWEWISSGGMIDEKKLIYETSHDVREGLFSKLNELESAGKFLNRWTKKDRFLWLLDFTETKTEGYDYKKISKEKLLKCPEELQKIVGLI